MIIYQNDPSQKQKKKRNKNKIVPFGKKKVKNLKEIMYKIMNEAIEDDLEANLKRLKGEGICILSACKHIFHKKCIEGWFRENNSCPFCRKVRISIYFKNFELKHLSYLLILGNFFKGNE